jgi:hypothetical protein
MTDAHKDKDTDDSSRSRENIFQIMDGIIVQLNKTKKLFIIMILSIMIIPPITFAVTFALLGPPFPFHDMRAPPDRFGPGFNPLFRIGHMIPFVISIVWLGVGIWQWFVLSKWSKKYERYKELQRRIDEKLDYGNNHDEGKKNNQ